MTKKKNFHGVTGKKLAKAYAFFHRANPNGRRNKKTAASVTSTGGGRVGHSMIETGSASIVAEEGGFVK